MTLAEKILAGDPPPRTEAQQAAKDKKHAKRARMREYKAIRKKEKGEMHKTPEDYVPPKKARTEQVPTQPARAARAAEAQVRRDEGAAAQGGKGGQWQIVERWAANPSTVGRCGIVGNL